MLPSTSSKHVGFSSCGTWAQLPCGTWNFTGPRIKPYVPYIARKILNLWTSREVQKALEKLTLEKIKDQINQLKIQSASSQLILDLVQTISDTAARIYVLCHIHI